MENNINKLITIKQLPIIEQMLDSMSVEIDKKIKKVMKIAPTESNVLSETKKIRAELNKELAELETARKKVKSEIMKPYLEFEELYKVKISDKYNKADRFFKAKIDEIENAIKDERKEKLQEYFNEYCKAQEIDCICFDDIALKINLSGSDKSYRDKIKTWIDKVKKDLEVINTARDEQTKAELLLEYRKDFNLQRAILEHEKRERELGILKENQSKEKESDSDTLQKPTTEEDTEVFEMTFKVKGTKSQLKALKEYLIENKLI